MAPYQQLSDSLKNLIIKAAASGKPQAEIARDFDVHQSTVSRIIKQFKTSGTVHRKLGSGRPKITSPNVDKILVRLSKANPRLDAVQLNTQLRQYHDVNCSVTTTKRRLNEAGLFGRRPAKKPWISKKNRRHRVKFAKEHLHWTSEDWMKVLWSDESKSMMFGSDGIKFVRREVNKKYDPRYQLPTVKHGGGNIMVWGCFSRDSIGPLHRIEGIMDGPKYVDIIKKHMLPHAKSKMPRGWIFQQDNDPKHTSNVAKNFFTSKKIRVLDWPSQSPDLNPIENLWDELERATAGRKPTSKDELFQILNEAWKNIPLDTLIKLVDSMPKRCEAVIKAKGYATKY